MEEYRLGNIILGCNKCNTVTKRLFNEFSVTKRGCPH